MCSAGNMSSSWFPWNTTPHTSTNAQFTSGTNCNPLHFTPIIINVLENIKVNIQAVCKYKSHSIHTRTSKNQMFRWWGHEMGYHWWLLGYSIAIISNLIHVTDVCIVCGTYHSYTHNILYLDSCQTVFNEPSSISVHIRKTSRTHSGLS